MIGWLTNVAEGTSLIYLSRLETLAWDEVNDHKKSKALYNAYNRLRFDPQFSFPVLPTVAELEKLKLAQTEMAYYLLVHLSDEDRRKGIQAQGVTNADIVGETYSEAELHALPVPPFVLAILTPWIVTASLIYPVDVKRAENAEVDQGLEIERTLGFDPFDVY